MPKLDLTPFYGADPLRLAAEQLRNKRREFATAICDFAATCKNNAELLDALTSVMPEGAGPQKLGQGSTRTTWSLPFGLVMKLNHEEQNPITPHHSHWLLAGLSWIEARQALSRRRHSSWREMTLALRYPNLFPPIYGVLFAFGDVPQNPCVIIMEQVTPLSEVFGNDDGDFNRSALCINPRNGRLRVFDPRLTNAKHSDTPCAGCFSEVFGDSEEVTAVANVGIDTEGRLFLLDGGNYFSKGFSLAPGWVPDRTWWLETPPNNPAHMRQTVEVSRMIFDGYSDCRAIWQK